MKHIIFVILLLLICTSCTDNSIDIKPDYSHRNYDEYIPSSIESNTATDIKPALLFVLHGSGGRGLVMKNAIGMDELAEQNNFIVVYPDGINGRWDLDLSCYEEPLHAEDDYEFIDYLIDYYVDEYNVDRSKVFASGFSNGAMFSLALPTRLPGRFRGIVSVAGLLNGEIANKLNSGSSLSVMMINGTVDSSVPWDPQETGDCGLMSVDDSILKWRELNDASSEATIKEYPDQGNSYVEVTRYMYPSFHGNYETSLVKVDGGGHRWYMYEEFHTSHEIVEFMERQNAFD